MAKNIFARWVVAFDVALTQYDLFQLNMSTFSTSALILGHHRTGTQIYQPNLESFRNKLAQYTISSIICVMS